jgi:hypothetical protein
MDLEIKISELRMVVNRIFDHIENELGQRIISLSQDDYWELGQIDRYDFTKDPSRHEVGKLYDDWEFLSAILTDENNSVPYMLVHLAPLLRFIGEEVEFRGHNTK